MKNRIEFSVNGREPTTLSQASKALASVCSDLVEQGITAVAHAVDIARTSSESQFLDILEKHGAGSVILLVEETDLKAHIDKFSSRARGTLSFSTEKTDSA